MAMTHRWLWMQKRFLKIVVPMLRHASPAVAAALLDGFGWIDYAVFPGPKRAYLDALERVRRDIDVDWDNQAVARRMATGLIHWRCRDRLLDNLGDQEALARFQVQGRGHLEAAYARRRGVILLGNHFGCHLHPAHWLFRERYPLRLFMERPRNTSRYLSAQLDTTGPLGQEKLFISRRSTPTEAAGSILRASRILKAGMILKIASDVRWHGAHTAPGHFLGSTYLFSTTWVVLAAMTGAAVVPVFCRPDDRGSYLLEFLPDFRVAPEVARTTQAIAAHVQRGLDAIAERVIAHPGQSNDYFEWPRPEIALNRPAQDSAGFRAVAG